MPALAPDLNRIVGPLALSLLAWGTPGSSRAQTIRDTVREHVTEGLEGPTDPSPPTAKPKKEARKRAPARPVQQPPEAVSATPAESTAADTGADATEPEPPSAEEDQLPKRIFGKNLQLDPKIGAGFRGWYPEQYPLVSINHAGYYTWSLDLKAKLFGFLRQDLAYTHAADSLAPRFDLGALRCVSCPSFCEALSTRSQWNGQSSRSISSRASSYLHSQTGGHSGS